MYSSYDTGVGGWVTCGEPAVSLGFGWWVLSRMSRMFVALKKFSAPKSRLEGDWPSYPIYKTI